MDLSGPSVTGVDWSDFYDAQTGRDVRPTFAAAVAARGARPPGFAVDIGCGDGVETRALLDAGWCVLAFDADPQVEARVSRDINADIAPALDVRRLEYADVRELPAADLVYAGYALPFCEPAVFERVWAAIRSALRPGAVFGGEFFGPEDDWANKRGMNVHDRTAVLGLLDGLDIVQLTEENRPGRSFAGPKHWHVFHVVATAGTAGND